METIYTDLLSVGAGLAGERVAVEAASEGFKTICLSIVPPRRSHSSPERADNYPKYCWTKRIMSSKKEAWQEEIT